MYRKNFYICILFIISFSVITYGRPETENIKLESHKADHHFTDPEEAHDPQYDHEQFLGEDISKTFDQLSPEESKRRLGVIVDQIDSDKDGFVNLNELKKWIQFTQRRYIDEDVTRQWKQHNVDNNEFIHWETYRKSVYGFMDDMDQADIENDDGGFSYQSMLARDRRRWSVADMNGDDELSYEEFKAFLHPEEMPQMKDVVLTETIEDIDKDKDGKISADEYIGDMYKSTELDEEEPEWVRNERKIFQDYRDTDKDNFLDRDEVRLWITPNDFDHAEAESKHLIYEADSNADEKLTKDEILNKYDLFVGSQATDFGEALNRHDEF